MQFGHQALRGQKYSLPCDLVRCGDILAASSGPLLPRQTSAVVADGRPRGRGSLKWYGLKVFVANGSQFTRLEEASTIAVVLDSPRTSNWKWLFTIATFVKTSGGMTSCIAKSPLLASMAKT